MAVWGIGAYNKDKRESRVKEFINNGCACIGWTRKQAPTLYRVFDSIKNGDIIYIKSYYIKEKRVSIKAIGKVIEKDETKPDKDQEIKVNWICKHPIEPEWLNSQEIRYNVYLNTLYQEYNSRILEKIGNAIGEKLI